MNFWMVFLGWILFAGTHIGLSAEPFRGKLVSKMGEKGFQGFYSLVALATFAFLVTAFVLTDNTNEFFPVAASASWMTHLCNLIMLFAFILFFCGFANPSPMGMATVKTEAIGIIRITRHPMNMSFALFGLAHILTNRSPEEWMFYLGFLVYGVLGSMHQDRKKAHQGGINFQSFVENTSILPFAAIITGKQTLKLGEISKKGVLIAIVATILARVFHPSVWTGLF